MKKMFVIVLALLVIAMFVVSGCAPGSFTGEAKAKPSAKKPTARYPDPDHFEVMKARFVSLGVSEDEMWKKLRSSNVILYDFKGDMQMAFALRQINDPKVDAKTKQASKEWVKEKINKQYASFTADDLKNTAWLITAENSLKAVSLKLSAYSSDLPLDPEGLKAYLDKTGEGGAAGSAAGAGGSGGAPASGGKSASTVKAGSSMLDCVQGAAAKSLTGDGNRPKTPEKKTAGGKPSVTDGSGDSTTTEGNQEGKPSVGGPCGTVDWNAKNGNGGISGGDTGNSANSNEKQTINIKGEGKDANGKKEGQETKVTIEKEKGKDTYKVSVETKNDNNKKDVAGNVVTDGNAGKGPSELGSGLSGESAGKIANKVIDGKYKEYKNAGFKMSGNAPQVQQSMFNPDADPAKAACADAVSACASTPGQFFGPNAQLKQLLQDCLDEGGKSSKAEITGGASTKTKEGGSSSDTTLSKGSSQKPAPSACDKIPPSCFDELSNKGPVIDLPEKSTCLFNSAEALGFSKQMMVTDPVDLVGKLGMISQAAQTSQAAQKASTGSASTTATGTASATTGTASTGANDQKAAAGSGECGCEACA